MKAKTLADMLLTQRKEAREEMNLRTVSLAGMLLTQRKEGRREVVEWIEKHPSAYDGWGQEWQAQLKVWGIDED